MCVYAHQHTCLLIRNSLISKDLGRYYQTHHIQTPLLPFHDCLSDHDRSWTRTPSHPAWRSVTWSSSSRERLARRLAIGCALQFSCMVLRYSPDSFVPQRYAQAWLAVNDAIELRLLDSWEGRCAGWMSGRCGILRKQVSFISSRCCHVRFRVKHFCLKACNPLQS